MQLDEHNMTVLQVTADPNQSQTNEARTKV